MSASELRSGPLAHPHRKVIAVTVQKGQAVEDPDDAPAAITYANWLVQRYRVVIAIYAVLGLLGIAIGISQAQWISIALGVGWLVLGVMYGWLRVRARRSISLNQGARVENER